MQDHPKMARQLDLEEEMRSLGVERFRALIEGSQKYGTESEAGATSRLLREKAPALVEAIRARFCTPRDGKAGRAGAAARYLKRLEPEVSALIALRGTLDRLSSLPTQQKVAHTIGSMIEDELHFRHFRDQEAARSKLAKEVLKAGGELPEGETTWSRFESAQEIATKNTGNAKIRRKQIKRASKAAEVAWVDWDQRTHMLVGLALIETLIEATGLVRKLKDSDSTIRIVTEDDVAEWITAENRACEALSPVYLPTVVPPKPWTSPRSGGYYTRRVRGIRIVKTNNRPFLEELEGTDLSRVYRALNIAQGTAWAVNASVLNVMQEMVDTAHRYAEAGERQPAWFPIPNVDKVPIPETPADLAGLERKDMTEEQLQRLLQRNAEARVAYKDNATMAGRRVGLAQLLFAAWKMLPEGEFWMPHNLDTRGRIYAVPTGLNPQGGDMAKALLRFAKTVPILGATDARWLAVHGAGCFGVDKVSMEERERWVYDNEAAILASAEDPMRNTFWAEKGDAKSKWCALAFCFEWAGFRRVGYGFESSLPIAQDGTCNGLQNFSAMLRDEQGGAAVNLVPGNKPSDVYGIVAKLVQRRVDDDAFDGVDFAQGWVGKVDRSVCKRMVMTMPYGSQQFGFKEQLQTDILEPWKKAAEKGGPAFPWRNTFEPALYLAKLIWEEVQKVVVKAAEAMQWLREAATAVAKTGLPVRWTTPMGLTVQQFYQITETKQYETTWGGARLTVYTQEPTGALDVRKQASAMPPNFVHSLDAAHLMRTITACADAGIDSFALIHDSYGTHAGNSQRLADHLRAEFVQMYSETDILADLKAELEEQSGIELRPLPEKGALDLQKVLQSTYFFA